MNAHPHGEVETAPFDVSPIRFRAASRILACSLLALLATGCVGLEPLTDEQVAHRVSADLASMYAGQEPVSGAIGLYEAIARALKYNLDKRLKAMERELVASRLDHLQMSLLPQAAGKAGWRERNSFRGSSSRSLLTGNQSLEVSTSEDRDLRLADLQVAWNVLDFGLTYFRSRQEADQVLIAEERRIKTIQNLIQDTRDAYWRAVAAERLLPQVKSVLATIEGAIGRSARVANSGDAEPNDELKLQRTLLVHKRELVEVRRKLALAKSELAALMNLAPGTHFRVALPARAGMKAPSLAARIDELESHALSHRPELREEDYKGRIAATELTMAYVRLLPGIELSRGTNYESNSFLFDHHWLNAGAQVTKNLMELVAAPRAIRFAETNIAVADARRQALSMAVVTQLHLALQRHALAREVFAVTDSLVQVDTRLSQIAQNAADKDGGALAEAVQAQSQRLVTQLHHYTAYADVQNAHGRVLNSLGAYRLPQSIETLDVAALKAHLRDTLDDWRSPVEVLAASQR